MAKHSTVVKALIFDDQSRLLMIFNEGFWDLPGGKVEHGEKLIEALARELEEELGLFDVTISPQPAIAWTMTLEIPEADEKLYKIELDYIVKTNQKPTIMEPEIEKLDYFDRAQLQTIAEESPEFLKKIWNDFLEQLDAYLTQ